MRNYSFQFRKGYWITPEGEIYSQKVKKFLKLNTSDGSKRFGVYNNGKLESWTVAKVEQIIKWKEQGLI